MGKTLNLEHPKTFNEKLQWLKLYDRNPAYTRMVDKYEVRKYVKETIGERYLIPLVGGPWLQFEEIVFSTLPEQFVLKCTHDSGSVAICRNQCDFDTESVRKKFNRALKGNFFYGGREWPYKNVQPRIIAEQYIAGAAGEEIVDYKLHCFHGVMKFVLVCADRTGEEKKVFYDSHWNKLPLKRPGMSSDVEIPKPQLFDEMVQIAKIFSKGIPFLRVDLYEISKKIYFGELTFFPAGGFEAFEPEEWDEKIGEWLVLPNR
ncbi:MAG: glycosyl transferase [Lachnospiraceae bacterium]|nr:glycosyl transferase [Lachnospiraceae bacterium]